MQSLDLTDTASKIRDAMAKAFFASAYADQYDEAENPGFSASGCDWLDLMPDDMDPAALHAADTLVMDMLRANGGKNAESLLDFVREHSAGDREATAEMFGHYLAMQAMGHGVGLGDAFGRVVYESVKVPYVEFSGGSLANDYFTNQEES